MAGLLMRVWGSLTRLAVVRMDSTHTPPGQTWEGGGGRVGAPPGVSRLGLGGRCPSLRRGLQPSPGRGAPLMAPAHLLRVMVEKTRGSLFLQGGLHACFGLDLA